MKLTDDELKRFPRGTSSETVLSYRTEQLLARASGLEGSVRALREELNTLTAQRQGDAAEIEALKRRITSDVADRVELTCPVKGCAICVERADETPDLEELRRRYEHHITRVEDQMCETTRAEFAATESLRGSYRRSIDDLARALWALRRVCDALEVLPGLSSSEIPGRIEEVLEEIEGEYGGDVEALTEQLAKDLEAQRRNASAFRVAGEQRALELVTLQEQRAADLLALLDALGMDGGATGQHAWQAAIERARSVVAARDTMVDSLGALTTRAALLETELAKAHSGGHAQALHQRDVARADLAQVSEELAGSRRLISLYQDQISKARDALDGRP
jgi:hypothetical protein